MQSEQNGRRGQGEQPLLSLKGITKAFPGTLANDNVGFDIGHGEIHALLGENGAGKSTLVKIIYGVLKADAGEVIWDGQPLTVAGPAVARKRGIGMVFQHFSLFEAMTVQENIGLAVTDEKDRKVLRQRIIEVSKGYGLPLDPDRFVHTMSVGERQRIEIVRCLLANPKLLILDEPTSVLTPQEVERLFETLNKLSSEGCAILYISHKLHEVQELCEHATILRGGRVVAECNPKVETPRSMAELMIGDKLKPPERSKPDLAHSPTRLEVADLSRASDNPFGVDLDRVSFTVKGGEILGVAGIAGSGQVELMAALAGETRMTDNNDCIRIDGEAVAASSPAKRRALGAVFVPEERNGHGAVPAMTLAENAFLTAFHRMKLVKGGLIQTRPTEDFAADIIQSFDVRTTGPEADAGSLSGGNLQKFIVGREVRQEPGVMAINQPTWGVDAGAAAAIHQQLIDLSARGAAVLVISQDLDEIFAVCDHICVMAEGHLSEPRPIGDVTVDEIGLLMGGLHDQSSPPLEEETSAGAGA